MFCNPGKKSLKTVRNTVKVREFLERKKVRTVKALPRRLMYRTGNLLVLSMFRSQLRRGWVVKLESQNGRCTPKMEINHRFLKFDTYINKIPEAFTVWKMSN